MSERQRHGFAYEQYVIDTYDLEKAQEYTSVWDARTRDDQTPVSIKTKRLGGNVEMGSFSRNAYGDESFFLAVGFWQWRKTRIVEEHVLYIPRSYWDAQFPDEDLNEEVLNMFDGITNSYADDAKWRERRRDIVNRWNELNTIIRIHPKRDHKKQRRVQCSIRTDKFYEELVPRFATTCQDVDLLGEFQ